MASKVFLITFLPTLIFDRVPELGSEEVGFFLNLNLSSHELKAIEEIHSFLDAENCRLYLLGQPMLWKGTITHEDLIERIEENETLPPGLEFFFSTYKRDDERREHAHELIRFFFTHSPHDVHPFVKKCYHFENTTRHVLAFLRGHALRQPYSVDIEEIGFDLLHFKSWPPIFHSLSSLWQAHFRSPIALEKAVARWRFEAIATLCAEAPPFSLDHILAYVIRLGMIEIRHEMKTIQHPNILERIAKAVQ
jgi:hypothetical protein